MGFEMKYTLFVLLIMLVGVFANVGLSTELDWNDVERL